MELDMLLPRGNEYNIAAQNPSTAFSDTDLKICEAETEPLGLPKPYSGGFVITYHLYNHAESEGKNGVEEFIEPDEDC